MAAILECLPETLPSAAPAAELAAPVAVGLLFLDLGRRKLTFLNESARWLRSEGVPLTSADVKRSTLVTPDGRSVKPGQLPLMRALREGRAIEATFLLERSGQPDATIVWHAAPLWSQDEEMLGVAASVCCLPSEPDWKGLTEIGQDLCKPITALRLLSDEVVLPGLSRAELRESLRDVKFAIQQTLRVGMDFMEWSQSAKEKSNKSGPSWFHIDLLVNRLSREESRSLRNRGIHWLADTTSIHGSLAFLDRLRFDRLLTRMIAEVSHGQSDGIVALRAYWHDEPLGKSVIVEVASDTGAASQTTDGDAPVTGEVGNSRMDPSPDYAAIEQYARVLDLDVEMLAFSTRGRTLRVVLPWWRLRPGSTIDQSRGEQQGGEEDSAVPETCVFA